MIYIKNTVVICFLFFSMLVFIYIFENKIGEFLKNIESKADEIEIKLDDKEYEEAFLKSQELYNIYKEKMVYLDMILNHSDTYGLNEEILKLTQYAKSKSDSDGLASVHYVKAILRKMINQHFISAENIF